MPATGPGTDGATGAAAETEIEVGIEATVRALAPRLLRFCLGRFGAEDLAEETAQEALSALVARWRRHGPPESPEAFVFAVARRRGSRAALRRRLTAPLAALGSGHETDPGADPETRAMDRHDLGRTLAAIRRLSAGERDALLLVAAGELSTAEAARVLGISRSALKMRVHRARGRLERALEETEP
ncbi:MAG: RNA polymerase sigma factor [Acidobacteriota bacterium]